MSEELQTKILGFLIKECGRTDLSQCVQIRLFFAPPSGYSEEEIASWHRKDDPERFEVFPKQEEWATEILATAQDHANAQPKGRYRYALRTLQHCGTRLSHQFALQPMFATHDETSLVLPDGGGASASALALLGQGFQAVLRSNTQMWDGGVRVLAVQNANYAKENSELRDDNFKLRRENEELRSNRMEKDYQLRALQRKDAIKEQGAQKLFQVLDLAMQYFAASKGLLPKTTATPSMADGPEAVLIGLVEKILRFGANIQQSDEKMQGMVGLLSQEDIELFQAIMVTSHNVASQRAQQAQNQSQSNGAHAPA